jgi:adenosylmethionine-8-amino-7-oxononanoate aminotransferase
MKLEELDKDLIWHPFTPLVGSSPPLLIQSAKGIYLETKEGRKIIDAISSWWVNIHGHSNEFIADAVHEQAKKLEHVIFAGFTHEPAIRLAQNLQTILPGDMSKIFFSDDGSTAVEVALKMALQYWYNYGSDRKKVIAIRGAYHGDTFGAMAVGERGMFTDPFRSHLFDVAYIDFPLDGTESNVLREFKDLLATGEIAAFIFEPLVQGAAGMRMYSPRILDSLIKEAKQHDVICIADEVFTGFGRTGRTFACEYLSETPDIIAVSKGITGGTMALGVTACSRKIVVAFESSEFTKTFFHGHSYTANPLACAAANASFELLMRKECHSQMAMINNLHEAFRSRVQGHEHIKEVRCLGTILAIELRSEDETSYANDLRKKIYPFFLERDILLRPLGNVIYVLPPYVIQEAELNKIYSAIGEFFDTVG